MKTLTLSLEGECNISSAQLWERKIKEAKKFCGKYLILGKYLVRVPGFLSFGENRPASIDVSEGRGFHFTYEDLPDVPLYLRKFLGRYVLK